MFSILTLVSIYEKNVFTQGSSLSKFVDVIQLVFPVTLHVIVIVEGFLKTKQDERIRNLIHHLEKEFAKQGVALSPFNYKLKVNLIALSFVVQFVSLSVELYIIATITFSPDWMRHWLSRIFSFAFARLATFNFVLVVEYLSSRLSVVNSELLSLKRYSKANAIDSSQDRYLHQKLMFVKKSYRDLWRISDLHNERHSAFILGSMTSLFICLTIDFYWMYANLYYGGNIFILRE